MFSKARISSLKILSTCILGVTPSVLLTGCSQKETEKERPNFLIIVSDDQRADQLSYLGKQVIPELKTPNIDNIAAQGVYFSNAFVTSPISCVSRASIATGRYVSTHGMNGFNTPLKEDVICNTYHALLRNAGYRTGLFGKWGVGMKGTEKIFDEMDAWYHQGRYFIKTDTGKIHETEWVAAKAEEFLASDKGEKPFCLTLCFKSPHHPYQPDPRDTALFKDVNIPKRYSDTPEAYRNMAPHVMEKSLNRWCYFDERKDDKTKEKFEKDFLRCVVGLDRAVGKVMASLEKHHLDKNTVVIFISDNGYLWGEHGLGGKWLQYEESIHVPIIVKWPQMKKIEKGKVLEQLVLNIDIAPTLLDMAGVQIPEVMDGKSLLPLMENRKSEIRSDFFLEHDGVTKVSNPIPDSYGIRTKDWKYIRYVHVDPEVEEMYDLKNDPYELKNLINDEDYAGKRDELRKRYNEYKSELSK